MKDELGSLVTLKTTVAFSAPDCVKDPPVACESVETVQALWGRYSMPIAAELTVTFWRIATTVGERMKKKME
jgi:hypothetical protein